MDIREKVKKMPDSAGVYIMRSREGKTLYVGKAASLRKRIRSYFFQNRSLKTAALMDNTADIEYIECLSPEQALILEAALIKEEKPKYNIALRDDKSYPYAGITKEDYPRVFVSRSKDKAKGIFFGPYPKAGILKKALNMLRKLFPYRSCRNMPERPCLYYHIRLCPACCLQKVSPADYRENIKNISMIFRGERKELIEKMRERMERLASENRFEEAVSIRDKVTAINNLYEGKPPEHRIISLKKTLSLPAMPLQIEAIDISSLGDKDAVGALAVFIDGQPHKKSYRRFLIKSVEGINDYAMVSEVARRRYGRLLHENRKLPDLIVIDGGLGHVKAAEKELVCLGINIPLIGISKKNEEIWVPGKKKPLKLSRGHPSLKLIQHIRDEAHRFANSYQKLRRSNSLRGGF